MAEKNLRGFIKGYDRYSKPVTLHYNRSGAFKTTCGGLATIVTFLIFCSWLTLEFIEVYAMGGYFSQNSKVEPTYEIEDSQFPVYNLELDDLLITGMIESRDPQI